MSIAPAPQAHTEPPRLEGDADDIPSASPARPVRRPLPTRALTLGSLLEEIGGTDGFSESVPSAGSDAVTAAANSRPPGVGGLGAVAFAINFPALGDDFVEKHPDMDEDEIMQRRQAVGEFRGAAFMTLTFIVLVILGEAMAGLEERFVGQHWAMVATASALTVLTVPQGKWGAATLIVMLNTVVEGLQTGSPRGFYTTMRGGFHKQMPDYFRRFIFCGDKMREWRDHLAPAEGRLQSRTAVLMLFARILLMTCGVLLELGSDVSGTFSLGPVADTLAGLYMLIEAVLAGIAASESRLLHLVVPPTSVRGHPVTTALFSYVLPYGVSARRNPFLGQFLLSPPSVVVTLGMTLPIAVALWALSIATFSIMTAAYIFLNVILALVAAAGCIHPIFELGMGMLTLPLLFFLSLVVFAAMLLPIGCGAITLVCVVSMAPLVILFVGAGVITHGGLAMRAMTTILMLILLSTLAFGGGFMGLVLGIESSATAQVSSLLTVLVGWCVRVLLIEESISPGIPDQGSGNTVSLIAPLLAIPSLCFSAPVAICANSHFIASNGFLVRGFEWLFTGGVKRPPTPKETSTASDKYDPPEQPTTIPEEAEPQQSPQPTEN